jgi:hypothetical protein
MKEENKNKAMELSDEEMEQIVGGMAILIDEYAGSAYMTPRKVYQCNGNRITAAAFYKQLTNPTSVCNCSFNTPKPRRCADCRCFRLTESTMTVDLIVGNFTSNPNVESSYYVFPK